MNDGSSIMVGPAVFQDQREVLQEQFGLAEEHAEEIYEEIKTNVMLSAQEADRDLNDSEVNEITNTLLAQANAQQLEQMQSETPTWMGLTTRQLHRIQDVVQVVAGALIGGVIGINIADGVSMLSMTMLSQFLALGIVVLLTWQRS